jgi:putative transposase
MRTKNSNSQASDVIVKMIENADSYEGIASLFREFMSAFMKKERDFYLEEHSDDKANGFYERALASAAGNLELLTPRVRSGLFRSFLLPEPWKRQDLSYDNLLISLLLQSYSPGKIRALLQELNLPYSPDQIDELRDELYAKAVEFKNRQLPADTFALFIDAYHTDAKDEDTGRVHKTVIYTVIGVGLDGKKTVYGYFDFKGSESKEEWLHILNTIIARGLKRVMLIASDDFTGLSDAISVLFPKSDHQLCFVHFLRNAKRNMSKDDAATFTDEIQAIKHTKSFEDAVDTFSQICDKFYKKYPAYIDHIRKNKERYFQFLKYPKLIRKHIYTTNIVENFNGKLETLRVNSGGYFQSSKTIDVAVFVLISRLLKNKWKKPIPAFQACKYEIEQSFNAKFAHLYIK